MRGRKGAVSESEGEGVGEGEVKGEGTVSTGEQVAIEGNDRLHISKYLLHNIQIHHWNLIIRLNIEIRILSERA